MKNGGQIHRNLFRFIVNYYIWGLFIAMHTIVQDKTISHLRKGEKATIVGYIPGEVPLKIYEMGLLPGVIFTVKQRLPLSGPVCLHIHGNPNGVALRRTEADLILIEPLS